MENHTPGKRSRPHPKKRKICLARRAQDPVGSECQNAWPCQRHCAATVKWEKRNGVIRYCPNYPVPGRTRCRFHGGASLAGINAANYKHGNTSKYLLACLPDGLRQAALRKLNDPDYTSLREQLAILYAREVELTKQLQEAQPPPWPQVVDALETLEQHMPAELPESAREAYQKMRELVRTGRAASERNALVWEGIQQICQEVAKLAAVENKLNESKKLVIKVEEVAGLLMNLLLFIREKVPDRDARQAIQLKVNTIMDGYAGRPSRQLAITQHPAPGANS